MLQSNPKLCRIPTNQQSDGLTKQGFHGSNSVDLFGFTSFTVQFRKTASSSSPPPPVPGVIASQYDGRLSMPSAISQDPANVGGERHGKTMKDVILQLAPSERSCT